MAQQQQGIALNQASQGSALPEGNMEILDASFCEWDYNGTLDHFILALGVQFQGMEDGKTHDQYYSAGELTYFVPSDDGSVAVPVADKTMLTDNCNAWRFLASLIEVGGEPMNELLGRGNVKELIGMKVVMQPFSQPERRGLIRGGKNPEKEKQVSLVVAILAWPGQEAPAPAKKTGLGAGQAAGKPVQGRPTQAPAQAPGKPGLGKPAGTAGQKATGSAPARSTPAAGATGKPNGQAGAQTVAPAANTGTEANSDLRTLVAESLLALLSESKDGVITKKELAPASFRKAGELVQSKRLDAKLRTEFVQLIFQDAFLHELAQSGMIAFDGAKVSFPG